MVVNLLRFYLTDIKAGLTTFQNSLLLKQKTMKYFALASILLVFTILTTKAIELSNEEEVDCEHRVYVSAKARADSVSICLNEEQRKK